MNPKLRVATIVAEPLVAQALGTTGERRNRAKQVLEEVGLCGEDAHRFPSAFSAGERQRIAIARALAPSPELLILDEPVAALDATVQARILNLIDRLRHRRELSVVLVSHDLAVVRGISDHVTVMFRGAVIEQGPTTDVLDSPAHPYTRELREAAPGSGLQRSPPLAPPVDDSSAFGAEACRYAGRCPSRETRCASEPPLVEVADGRRAACWLA